MKTVERRSATSRGAVRPAAILVCVALLGAAACSSSKSKSAEPGAVDDDHTTAPGRTDRGHVPCARWRQRRVHRLGDAGRTCSGSGTSSTSTSRPGRRRRTRSNGAAHPRWPLEVRARRHRALPNPRAGAPAGGPEGVQRHRDRRVAERERRGRRRSRLGEPPRGDRASGRCVGRRVGAADRRRGRAGARDGSRSPAPRPRARVSRRSIRRGTARSSIPVTASRSTSTRRSPAPCAPARAWAGHSRSS